MSELRGVYGRCDLVKKVMSRGVVQIVVEIPAEYFAAAVQILDGQDVWVELVPPDVARVGRYCVIDGAPVTPGQPAKSAATPKPYGQEASELYKCGFWTHPDVLRALGTDEEYRKWIQNQPCIVCGGGDYVEKTGELLCEAAHVKRPSNSGMKHRPEYSCVPLCDADHLRKQHQHGLPYMYAHYLWVRGKAGRMQPSPLQKYSDEDIKAAREWLDKQRDKLLLEWATTVATRHFKVESTGYIPPAQLVAWARKHGIDEHLPAAYRRAT